MSAEVQHLERLAVRRRPAPLSQGFVAGLVAVCDSGALVTAAFIAGQIQLVFGSAPVPFSMPVVSLAVTMLLLATSAAGLYRFPAIMMPAAHVKKISGVCIGVGLGLITFGVAFEISARFSRIWALGWLICSMVGLIGMRFLVASSLRKLAEVGRVGRRIVIYGAGTQGEKLIRRIVALNEPWNQIVGVFDDRTERAETASVGYPVIGTLDDLVKWGQQDRPDEVLLALPWSAEDRILQILHRLAVLPANVRLASEFVRLDRVHGRTNTQFGLPMLNAYEKPVEGWGRIWKRAFDFSLAGTIIVISAPLLAVIALLIRIESPGPALFRQPRYGFNNKLIEVFKFRTMRWESSDSLGERLTAREDVRVTRVGAVLRRLSLDELPQLLNVLRSEMSLVGPRPHAVRTTAGGRQCDQVVDQYAVRHKVKPGITGWAQVNGWRGTMETEEHLVKRLEHDLFYINNWSPLFDIKILLLTVWTVTRDRNSY